MAGIIAKFAAVISRIAFSDGLCAVAAAYLCPVEEVSGVGFSAGGDVLVAGNGRYRVLAAQGGEQAV
jgi:hypothetical protein